MPVLDEINGLLTELNVPAVKTASTKKAEEEGAGNGSAAKDPGGKNGPSSSPTAKLDGNNHPAPAGFFAKEHTEDIKKDIPNNVEEAKENKQDSSYDMPQIGMKASPTGEDPSTENDYRTGGKDDPGTSSPIDAADIGQKYASMSFPDLYKLACQMSNDVLARLANGEQFSPTSQKQAGQAAPKTNQPAAAANSLTDEQATAYKFAAACDVVAAVIAEGYEDADMIGDLLYKTAAAQQNLAKAANDPQGAAMEGQTGMEAGLPGAAAGAGPAIDPAALAGGDPGAAHGAPDGDGDEGMNEDAINEIANALIDAGIPPEKLMEAAQMAMAGAPEAEPAAAVGGEGAGGPPKTASATVTKGDCHVLAHMAKLASDHMESGRFVKRRPQDVKKANERKELMETLGYVREVFKI